MKRSVTFSRSNSSRTSTTEYCSAISADDDEFYDLPSDLPSDGEITPTNETVNNGSISTNGLVEKALEKVENELDPEEKQQRKLVQTVDVSNLGTSLLT